MAFNQFRARIENVYLKPLILNRQHALKCLTIILFGLMVTPVVAQTSVIESNPGWASVVPALVAVVLALVTRSILPALFAAIWCGVWIAAGIGWTSIGTAFLAVFDTHILNALYDRDRLAIICFTLMMGGMVGVLSNNGGMHGLVRIVTRFASSARRGQIAITGLGFAIFFDDIANTLLIGKTMRPVADCLGISRQKLAYLVDSTAAPLASIALATTWVGYEVSLIGIAAEGLENFSYNPYELFLQSIAYSFYPLLTLFFVWLVALTGRDFGPMLDAERRARRDSQQLQPPEPMDNVATQAVAANAIVPIIVVVLTLVTALLYTGEGATLQARLSSADSFKALMWASFLGVVSAAGLALLQRVLTLNGVIDAWYEGVQATFFAMIVLVLSWTLADTMATLGTAQFLVASLSTELPIFLLPIAVFILSGIVAFTTGTSWGTMGIMLPLALPLAWAAGDVGSLVPATIAAVLSGATFGDHCSPISDTTVLASLASGCDHVEHVRTQAPYALVSALFAILFCALPVGLGVAWWICLPIAMIALFGFILIIGQRSDCVIQDFAENAKGITRNEN